MPRHPLARAYLLVTLALFGCTTSRAVQTYRQGWQAEARGDTGKANRLYLEAIERDGHLFGARLNRIRLLAQAPEGQDEARLLLEKLTKSEPGDPRVAAFAAMWALTKGDAAHARQRLDAARALRPEDPADAAPVLAEARVAVAAAQGRWADAWPLAQARTPTEATALRLATVAWNAGHAQVSESWAYLAPESPSRATILALAAVEAGRWREAEAALADLAGDAVTPLVLTLRARAALAQGDAAKAAALAGDAARRNPADAEATELWAVALLQAGRAATARDLLAGLTARGAGWTAWHHLGIAHLRMGDPAAATTAFQAAAQRCPTCAVAVKNAAALARLGY